MRSEQTSAVTLQHHINSIKNSIACGKEAKSREWNRAKHSDQEREKSNDAITWIDLQIAVMEMELERLEQELKKRNKG